MVEYDKRVKRLSDLQTRLRQNVLSDLQFSVRVISRTCTRSCTPTTTSVDGRMKNSDGGTDISLVGCDGRLSAILNTVQHGCLHVEWINNRSESCSKVTERKDATSDKLQ